MNRLRIIPLAILSAVVIASCTNDPNQRGGSTPIDSSNLEGAPGAVYGPDNPANPNPPRYEGQYDTGMQPNTMSSDDSAAKSLK